MNLEEIQLTHKRIAGLIFISCVTLGELLTISVSPILHEPNGRGVED